MAAAAAVAADALDGAVKQHNSWESLATPTGLVDVAHDDDDADVVVRVDLGDVRRHCQWYNVDY